MQDAHDTLELDPLADFHRREASYLYGVVISGAVLATSSTEDRLAQVVGQMFITLVVYWLAETYVHLIAARTLLQRRLSTVERRAIAADGWPLVAACVVPAIFIGVEALLGVPTERAVKLALSVNALLLLGVGWEMSRAGGLRGWRLVVSAVSASLLGLAMVFLKAGLH